MLGGTRSLVLMPTGAGALCRKFNVSCQASIIFKCKKYRQESVFHVPHFNAVGTGTCGVPTDFPHGGM